MKVQVSNGNGERTLPPEGKNCKLWLYCFCYFGKLKGKYSPSPVVYWGFEYADKFNADNTNEETGEIMPFFIGRTTYGKAINEFFVELAERDLTAAEKKEGFELDEVLGELFRVNVTHDESKDGSTTYANVRTIREKFESDDDVFDDLSDRVSDKIAFSILYNPRTEKPYKKAAELHKCPVFKRLPLWMQNRCKDMQEFLAFPDADDFPKEEK